MKLIGISILMIGGLAVPAGAATVARRQWDQQQRIGQGVHSGSLTAGEAARLEREEGRAAARIHRDRVDGGAFSAAERARAQRSLDRLSSDIYRLKHNGRSR
ncbi:MAG: hypothetical protein HY821_16735 [Acidobacteria bacterium]|nr:hypothetical protein [Acidobacteriota bacterium]